MTAQFHGQVVAPCEGSLQREQEWLVWLEEDSMHEPLTLNKTQMDMLALLMRWPFDQLMMVGQSAQLEEEWQVLAQWPKFPHLRQRVCFGSQKEQVGYGDPGFSGLG